MENLNNVPSTGTFGGSVSTINSNFDLVVNAINSLEYQTTRSKGILNYGQNPATVFPNAVAGDWCMILSQGNVFPATIKTFNGSTWSGSGTWNPDGVDLTQYAQKSEMTTAIANSLAQATARMGYGECTVSGTSLAVSIPNFILPTSGGTVHIKMSAVGTGASTLNINSTGAKTLWYNGAAVSVQNTWEANEIISVFYDGTRFMASNAQGGGGKAEKISYDNSQSGLVAENVQDAIDEESNKINEIANVVQIDDEPVPFAISRTVKRLWKVINGVVTESKTPSAIYYRVPRIDISGYNKVRAKFTLTGAIGAVTCFGDENNNLVGSTVSVNSGETILQIPEGAKYFYMTSREESTPDIYAYGIVSKNIKERYYEQVELNKDYNSHVSSHDVKNASGGLSVTDENGHVVMEIKNGHIKTGKFNSQQKLKILILGNSYSVDSFSYLPFILKNYGIDVCVGIYYRASGTLSQLVTGWSSARYYFYLMDTENQTQWWYVGDYTPKECVEFKDWDIITLQQQSDASHDFATYEPSASELIDLIYSTVQTPIQLAWNININNHSHSNVNQILTNIENCCSREPINMIFPYGTAIFNARTNEVLDAIGDYGHLWYEGTHLQEGLPCYIAALANVQAIFNKFYPKYTVANEKIGATITQEMINGWNVRGQHGTCTGISEENCRLAQKCAILANKKPFEITTIY